jgi:hypothetical protein
MRNAVRRGPAWACRPQAEDHKREEHFNSSSDQTFFGKREDKSPRLNQPKNVFPQEDPS